jgi:nicotinate-nucleotide pyrophosphorylase
LAVVLIIVFSLYDMIMLKDNRIDYCGGIERQSTKHAIMYKLQNQVKIESRNQGIDVKWSVK